MILFSENLSLHVKAPLTQHVVKQVILEAISHMSRTLPPDTWLNPDISDFCLTQDTFHSSNQPQC